MFVKYSSGVEILTDKGLHQTFKLPTHLDLPSQAISPTVKSNWPQKKKERKKSPTYFYAARHCPRNSTCRLVWFLDSIYCFI